ncbi:MAG TPA: hypothetical protein VG890_00880 [Puia sp.]|nr:hypothetical protein [Puia sp.]
MKYPFQWVCLFLAATILSCNNSSPSREQISQLNLKTGDLISCGPPDAQFGKVEFVITGNGKTKQDFNLAVELLHSFEYDEAEKAFAKIIGEAPDCAMAYWGVAMSNFHPLWNPPTETELQKGTRAIALAGEIKALTPRESGYIKAIGSFYKDWTTVDHHARCIAFEQAMEQLHRQYPDDPEAAIFYALSLDAAADPRDKTYANQKKAGDILNALYKTEPEHPGIIHYIIHTYDYPGLAGLALPAARKYAGVAPSSAHALHMPSHIFTRLGLWDEAIHSNLKSVDAAKCYAKSAGMAGHWDEELHGMDYLVYAYLQKGENKLAEEQVSYLDTIKTVYPANFKVAYAFAAIPSRYLLENKQWKEAASLQALPANFSWTSFPWQEAIIHFTRLLGAAHIGDKVAARSELNILTRLRDTLERQKDLYKAKAVEIQIKAGEAWMQFEPAHPESALQTMRLAADMEDSTEKHPVTPGEVLPARELLGDMLMQARQHEAAFQAYTTVLQKSPNRFNSLYGAAAAAAKAGRQQEAISFYKQLLADKGPQKTERPELEEARLFLK